MFSVEGTQCVFCFRHSICFLLYVLNVFSVEGTQCVSVLGTQYVVCFRY